MPSKCTEQCHHRLLQQVKWYLLDVCPQSYIYLCHVSFFLTSAKGIFPLCVTCGGNFLPFAKTPLSIAVILFIFLAVFLM